MNPQDIDLSAPSASRDGCNDAARRYPDELIAAIQELIDELKDSPPSDFEDADIRALGQDALGRLDALIERKIT